MIAHERRPSLPGTRWWRELGHVARNGDLRISERVDGGFKAPIEALPRVLFNADMRTANFMVPALVGIVMQLVTMFLTAFAIVREREYGTLEQLMVTPISGSACWFRLRVYVSGSAR